MNGVFVFELQRARSVTGPSEHCTVLPQGGAAGVLLSLPPSRGPPPMTRRAARSGSAAHHQMYSFSLILNILYWSLLEFLSLSLFGHVLMFDESPFMFELILRTLLQSACMEEGKDMETF